MGLHRKLFISKIKKIYFFTSCFDVKQGLIKFDA